MAKDGKPRMKPKKKASSGRGQRRAPSVAPRSRSAPKRSSPELAPVPAKEAAGEVGKRLSPAERRAQILRVAEALFAERPYTELGILDVARAASITQGLVYHYFESKEALFAAVVEGIAGALLRSCFTDRTRPIPLQFELGLKGYLDYVEAHRVAYLNLFRGLAASEPVFKTISDRTRQAIIDYMIEGLGLASREIPATRISLRGYVGYVEAAILDWLERPGVSRATLERMIFAVIITAVRMGLESDKDVPLSPAQLVEFERAYKRHFALP